MGRPRKYNAEARQVTAKPRGPYKTKTAEPRGKQDKENKIIIAFWKRYTMDLIESLEDHELDALIDEFFKAYEERNLAKDKSWWYPLNPDNRVIDMRYKK